LTSLAANKIVTNLNECLGGEQEHHAETRTDHSKDTEGFSVPVPSAPTAAVVDYETAWSLLCNPTRSTDFPALSELLERNGVSSAHDLTFFLEDPDLFENVVNLLKNIPQRQFRAMFPPKEHS
jgi:hypothetical protein